jgi:anti-sigma regulatory factor (Ser/Thr protein kinase)
VAEHRWELPHSIAAPALTRQLIAQACETGCVPESRVDDCCLMATELVTNALVHGRGEITLSVDCQDSDSVRVEVRDQGALDRRLVAPHHVVPDSETGRGLHIVDALAERWGVTACDSATCAWFEVRRSA